MWVIIFFTFGIWMGPNFLQINFGIWMGTISNLSKAPSYIYFYVGDPTGSIRPNLLCPAPTTRIELIFDSGSELAEKRPS